MVWCNGQTFLNCRTPFPPIDIIFLCCTVVKVASRFKIFPDRGVTRWPWIQNLCNSVILDVSTWNKNGNVGHNNGSVIYPNIISVSYWYSEILASTQSPIAISFICLFVSVCLCLPQCLSGRLNYEGLVPHKQYSACTLLGMSSCASYVSRTHDVIDDVTRSQSRSNFEIDISLSIFRLQRRSKAQNVEHANGYLSGIFNFRYNFRKKKKGRELKMVAILKIFKYRY